MVKVLEDSRVSEKLLTAFVRAVGCIEVVTCTRSGQIIYIQRTYTHVYRFYIIYMVIYMYEP